jgi:hypothetical protein
MQGSGGHPASYNQKDRYETVPLALMEQIFYSTDHTCIHPIGLS